MFTFKVNTKTFDICIYDSIETIALFGSCARNENDDYSDIDLLIIADDCSDKKYNILKNDLLEQLKIPHDWLSMYKITSVNEMNKYSSYFLWHLKLEGKIIYSRNGFIERILENLKEYEKTNSDLYQYNKICTDIKEAIALGSSTYIYELNLLASLARNTCMAICFKNNIKSFGRIEPVKICSTLLGDNMPFSIEDYNELYQYRIYYKRKQTNLDSSNLNSKDYIEKWIKKIEVLLSLAK